MKIRPIGANLNGANNIITVNKTSQNFGCMQGDCLEKSLYSLSDINRCFINFKGKKEKVNVDNIILSKMPIEDAAFLFAHSVTGMLQKAYDKNDSIDKKHLLNFLERVKYDPKVLNRASSNFDNALLISYLLDEKIIDDDDLYDDVGKETRFVKTITSTGLSERVLEDSNKSAFLNSKNGMLKLWALGGDISYLTWNRDVFNYNEIGSEIDENYSVSTVNLQGDEGLEITALKTENDPENKKIIITNKTYREKGPNTSSITEIEMPKIEAGRTCCLFLDGFNTNMCYNDKTDYRFDISKYGYWKVSNFETRVPMVRPVKTFYPNSDRVFYLEYDQKRSVKNHLEVIKDENNNPIKAIYKEKCGILDGAYKVTEYIVPTGMNEDEVKEKIKSGELTGVNISKTIQKPNGTIEVEENFENNGFKSKRKFTKKTYANGSLKSSRYAYSVKNEKGDTVFDLKRSFKRAKNRTETILNGKKYTAYFDDEKMTIRITDESGLDVTINIKEKLEEKYGNSYSKKKSFFEFLKGVPADTLLNLDKCTNAILVSDDKDYSGICNAALRVFPNLSTLSHETGHGIDFNYGEKYDPYGDKEYGKISGHKEVIELYNKEMKEFKKNCPEPVQNITGYFGQNGGGLHKAGLTEFLAETFSIFTTMEQSDDLASRTNYLIQYFPETISKIGSLTGYNSK